MKQEEWKEDEEKRRKEGDEEGGIKSDKSLLGWDLGRPKVGI